MRLYHSPGSLPYFLAVFSIVCRDYHDGQSCVGKGGSTTNAILIYPDHRSETPALGLRRTVPPIPRYLLICRSSP